MNIIFFVGLILGMFFLEADKRWFKKYYSTELNSYGGVDLITRSLVFVLLLIPLSLFVVTSTGSEIGSGLVLGIWIFLLAEMYRAKQDIDLFHMIFLSQLKKRLNKKDVDYLLMSVFGFILLLVFLTIR